MIDALLRLDDVGETALAGGKRYVFGASQVNAFSSHIIEMEVRELDGETQLWVGETRDPFEDERSAAAVDSYRDFRSCEGIKIFLRSLPSGPGVEVARTYAGGCPIYVSCVGGTICVSWKFEAAVALIPRPTPNIEACRIYLREATGHVRDQVIDGVHMLWPGESLRFDAAGLIFREIEPPLIVQSGTLKEGADACGAFLRTVSAAMQPVLAKAHKPLLELSGGYDSSCVGLAAKQVSDDFWSYSTIHDGQLGRQQGRRRAEIVSLLKTRDFEFPSYLNPPFSALQVEECRVTPFDDLYRLPCVYAIDAHPAGPFDVVVTGIGGDELTKEDTFRRLDHELPGHNSRSAGTAAAGRADMFLRRGIWPINPLISPSVVDFCRSLPPQLRSGRMLNILTLCRSGLSDGYIFPRYKEHYANVSNMEASLFDFDEHLSGSVVGTLGICDLGQILAAAREATLTGFDSALRVKLYLLMKLEAILRKYVLEHSPPAATSRLGKPPCGPLETAAEMPA